MDTPQAVSLNHISVTLGDTPVLHDISLSVAPGEFLSIIGPNGCGKSTLLKVVCHMIRPQSGQACLYGRPLSSYSRRQLARHMAILTQKHDIPEDMTVYELVSLGRFPYRTFYRRSFTGEREIIDKATPTPGTGLPFTDVPADRWSYPYIKQLYDAGVVSGTSATTFEPTANVTRAQFVTMIAGLAGADVSGYASGPFDDVQAGSWYAPYVNWAAASGIVSGTSATTFDPAAEISRQDMAVMLYNYAQQAGVQLKQTTVTPFTDESSIAAYALPAVQALHRAGVINGMPDGSFRPYDTATREQACAVLCAL